MTFISDRAFGKKSDKPEQPQPLALTFEHKSYLNSLWNSNLSPEAVLNFFTKQYGFEITEETASIYKNTDALVDGVPTTPLPSPEPQSPPEKQENLVTTLESLKNRLKWVREEEARIIDSMKKAKEEIEKTLKDI